MQEDTEINSTIRFIGAKDVTERLAMTKCVELMRKLFREISEGGISHRLRMAMPVDEGKLLGIMPGYAPPENSLGAKIITVYHGNSAKGLPSHQGIVAVFDAGSGSLKGIVDGMSITAIRTAAVSAVATDILAKKDAKSLALLGSGVQAHTHLEAISCVRAIETVRVWSRNRERARAFVEEESRRRGCGFTVCDTAAQAAARSDIICTVTSSRTPVLEGSHVQPGAHINAVGACLPADRELDSECVAKARFFGDSAQSVKNESGDYLFPLGEGVIRAEHFLGEIGDLMTGKISGRRSDTDITVFEALGLAVEDIVCASWLLDGC
jgi:ornithine cyclodeaminase